MKSSLDAARAAIIEAFPPTTLDARRAFGASGTSYEDAREFIDGTRGKSWPELDVEFLQTYRDAFHFLSAEAVAAYLPAYVVAALDHFHTAVDLRGTVVFGLMRAADDDARRHFDEWVACSTRRSSRPSCRR